MTQVAKKTESKIVDIEASKSAEKFHQRLNKAPNPKEVQVNKFAGNSSYLPISFIEMTLDELFFGMWRTENFQYQVVANELIGSIELVCLHPVTGFEIRRTGAAAVPIQMKSGSSVSDVSNKIINTLVKDFPHLKSSCLTNAARSLGKAFGRDLNRKHNDTYQPLILTAEKNRSTYVHSQIVGCKTIRDLEELFVEHQDLICSNTALVSEYNKKKKEIQK